MTEISAKYERLIQDLRQDFRPQREWGEGRGLFLVVGHFLVGVAAGAWLFGLAFADLRGLVIAFLLAGAGGIAHLAFLGRPERFWRMARHVRTSWISRGFVGLALFLVGAALYLPPRVLAGWPWDQAFVLGADLGHRPLLLDLLFAHVRVGEPASTSPERAPGVTVAGSRRRGRCRARDAA